MLTIGRKPGRAFYVGRDIIVTVTKITEEPAASYHPDGCELQIEAPVEMVVSGPEVSAAEHVARQFKAEEERGHRGLRTVSVFALEGQTIRIGRVLAVSALSFERRARQPSVRLGIEAPRHVAISRDDFTRAEHMRFVESREEGRPVG